MKHTIQGDFEFEIKSKQLLSFEEIHENLEGVNSSGRLDLEVELEKINFREMAPKASVEAKKRRIRLSIEDYEQILSYIKEPNNFAQLHNSDKKTKVGVENV